MAILKPFRGFRFNPRLNWEPFMYASPLCEIITTSQLERLRSFPNNTIHVSLPQDIEQAIEKIKYWKRHDILIQDPLPAFYPYQQQFSFYGSSQTYVRSGFIAQVGLNQAGAVQNIIPHEGVLEKSLASRAYLLQNSKLNITPIHCLYDDPKFEIEHLLAQYYETPQIQAFDEQGVINRFGTVQNLKVIKQIISVLSDKQLYLADGHHRLAASQHISTQLKDDNAQYVMAYLSNMAGNDLRILPTHRLIETPENYDEVAFLEKLGTYFNLTPFNKRAPLFEELKTDKHRMGWITPKQAYIITLKDEYNPSNLINLPLPDAVKNITYTILHYLVLDNLLGFSYSEQPKDQRISYIKDYSEVVMQVRQSHNKIAFIMNELNIEQMIKVCQQGAITPQKSTYFFPKVNTGYIFASIDDTDYSTPIDTWVSITKT